MKIFLNDCEVKETDHFILCDECVFRIKEGEYTYQCLAMIFHLERQGCMRGYQYEDNV